MGLTIHWQQAGSAAVPQKNITKCLEFAKEVGKSAGWEVLAEWDEYRNADEFQSDTEGRKPFSGMVRTRGISLWPHKDSESIMISFVGNRLGRLEAYGGGSKYQYDRFFCKTHYAGFETHKAVTKFLHAIHNNFVSLKVSDEGDYYGIWDDVAGKKAFGEYVAFVHGFGKTLSEALGVTPDMIISSHDSTDGWKDELVDHYVDKLNNKEDVK
jgi:hypothetical protein